MFLKKLEIFGFKSFADKTVLNFEPGITAIVGPNGCGKSNIFDSLRWALGEQSVKELRGGAMEDVIFNGTDKKPALGFTEVSLTFSNESRDLPVEYDEVTVTRRLFRSGESEYLLNKTVVRLKDILEIFMGTGVGAEAYSLIQQGKVDLIVSARPEDRRIIIDEASGITKYKSRKKEALNKLKDTEDNLLRINDIILEIKRQIASLERQANKAKKYKEEYEKLKGLEVKLVRHQLNGFSAQRDEINSCLEEGRLREAMLHEEFEKCQSLLQAENALINSLEQKINDIHSEELRLENQVEMDARQIKFNTERIEELTLSESRLAEQKVQLEKRCDMQQGRIDSLKEELSALIETIKTNITFLQEKRVNLETIIQTIRITKEAIKKEEERTLEISTQQVNIQNQLNEVTKESQGFSARKHRLDLERTKVLSEKEQADEKFKNVNSDIGVCSQKINELKGQMESQNQTVDQRKSRLAGVEVAIDELEKKKLFLNSQREFIEELRVQYQDIPDPVHEGVLLTINPPQEIGKGIIGKVKDVQALDPRKLEALRQNLGQLKADSPFYQVTCETKFIELDPQKIFSQIEALAQKISSHQHEREILSSEIQQNEKTIAELDQAIHDQEKVLSKYDAQKHNILEEANKLAGELELIDSELREARSTMVSLRQKEDEFTKSLATISEEFGAVQRGIQERQAKIVSLSQGREETTVAIAQMETEIALNRDKEKAQQENLKIFDENLSATRVEIQRVQEESRANQTKKNELEAGIADLKTKIHELENKKHSWQSVFDDYERQKTEVAGRVQQVQQKAQDVEQQIQTVKNQIHGYQMKDQEIAFREKSSRDRLTQTYKINLDDLAPEPVADGSLDVEALNNEVELLRKRCEAFGSVNLVAIEEFDQLKERYEFLTKQQIDLITAKESLMNTIYRINSTTKQLFMETFTKVSEEFRIYFRMLFGGGEAQLILVDQENVLESGIEIIARPPGKKLQNITLLSGGEKSLAAIALIFGVFKVRPSPFCILDEIDAALDESNVGRFGYLLKDFAKIAQFIVITHNKRTITNADVMYGITMQETGVSKIVSVKLSDERKEEREQVPVGAV